MLKRSFVCGLTAATLFGLTAAADAAVGTPSLRAAAGESPAVTPIRWVCGPDRCAYIPRYAGPVVVHPYMKKWAPPPKPHCMYVRGPRGRWALVCP